MNDRMLFFLTVVLIGVAVVSFDRYTVGKGEVSPIKQTMNYLGISKAVDRFSSVQSDTAPELLPEPIILESRGDKQSLFSVLLKEQEGWEITRREYMQKRNGTLDMLHEQIVDFVALVNQYRVSIATAHQELVSVVGELNQLQQELLNASVLVDGRSRENVFSQIKENVLMLWQRTSPNATVDTVEIQKVLQAIANIFADPQAAVLKGCPTAQACVQENLVVMQDLFTGMATVYQRADEHVGDILKELEQLRQQYELMRKNANGSEHYLADIDQLIMATLEEFADKLGVVTEADVVGLMHAFEALEKDRVLYGSNLEMTREYMITQYTGARENVRASADALRASVDKIDFNRFNDQCASFFAQSRELLQPFVDNEKNAVELLQTRKAAQTDYIYDAAESSGINMTELVARLQQGQ